MTWNDVDAQMLEKKLEKSRMYPETVTSDMLIITSWRTIPNTPFDSNMGKIQKKKKT